MKYKKTTVVGAALTLALVLAVSVGFASDPAADMPDEDAVTDPVYDDMGPSGQFVDADETEDDFVCYDPTSDPDVILREYKAVLDRAVAQGERTQAEADEMLANMETLIERAKRGEIEGLIFNRRASGEVCYAEELDETGEKLQVGVNVYYEDPENGTVIVKLRYDAGKDVWINPETGEEYALVLEGYLDTGAVGTEYQDGMYICTREDCGNNSVHEHDGVIYKGWRGKYSAPVPSICTLEGCTIQEVHYHDEDGKIFVYNGTAFVHAEIGDYDDQGGSLVYAEIRNYHEGEPIACPPEAIDENFYQKYGNHQDGQE